MSQNRAIFGLALKAGAIVVGVKLFEAIRNRSVHLVFLNPEASIRSSKQIKDKCAFYGIELIEGLESNQFLEIGKFVAAIGITNQQMAKSIKEKVGGSDGKTSKEEVSTQESRRTKGGI